MKPEDQKRLQREADIAKAVRGPDYTAVETEIARNKKEHAVKKKLGREAIAKEKQAAAYKRMLEKSGFLPQVPVKPRVNEGVEMTVSYYKSLEAGPTQTAAVVNDKRQDQEQER